MKLRGSRGEKNVFFSSKKMIRGAWVQIYCVFKLRLTIVDRVLNLQTVRKVCHIGAFTNQLLGTSDG